MAFNLLLESDFKTFNRWHFTNCQYQDGVLISDHKVFGIEQELTLPDIVKLYLRVKYKTINPEIFNIKIGIQSNKLLEINQKTIKPYKQDFISLVEDGEQEKIKVHIIFESIIKINKVEIKEPLLINLNNINKSTWIKWLLDRTIDYIPGYDYKNEYEISEIKPEQEDFKLLELDDSKIGSIFNKKENAETIINAKFIRDKYYLAKLDYKEINRFGKVYLQYGVLKSTKSDDEQCYLIFKGRDNIDLKLKIEANDVLPYQVNLKHIMIVDISNLSLETIDIPCLPFI